jgi:hypothetical protein
MQGRDDGQRQFFDVEAMAGHLLAAGSVFAFLAQNRRVLFPDEAFADLFVSGRGRPSIPADVVASVMVLQAIHGRSDRQAAEAVTFDLRWKAACGFAVAEAGFHPSVLTYWRRRLAASSRPHRIFEAVTQVIAQTGVLGGRRRGAIDSTILDDAVARQDTVTQLIESPVAWRLLTLETRMEPCREKCRRGSRPRAGTALRRGPRRCGWCAPCGRSWGPSTGRSRVVPRLGYGTESVRLWVRQADIDEGHARG